MNVHTQYCVYRHPRDYPGKFVVRKWSVMPGSCVPAAEPHAVCDTLDDARAALPDGLVRLDRHPEDDVAIAEVWL